jgi:anti-sigma B factor antagonist
MRYSVDKQEKYCVIRLHEEKLDSVLAPQLKSELVTLNAEGIENVILDMTEVKYTDSSGLSAILVGNRVFNDETGYFILVSVNDHVMKLIRISQLDAVLNIAVSVEEAIEAIQETETEAENENGQEDKEPEN